MIGVGTTTACHYYDGRSVADASAAVRWEEASITVVKDWIEQRHPIADVLVSPRTGRADRFVLLPNGAQLQCPDSPALDRLPQDVPSETFVAWLEQRWGYAVACIVFIAATLAGAYQYGVPWLAERAARRVPVDVEVALGHQGIDWADRSGLFKPTKLAADLRERLTEKFEKLSAALPYGPHYRLEFRRSSVGANAFAFPGGSVVVTDELAEILLTEPRIIAVLAHEIGHVEMKHSLRQLLAGSAAAMLLAAVTADAASLSTSVAGLPGLMVQTDYSREHERAADDFGVALLRARGEDPGVFAEALELIDEQAPMRAGRMDFLSTHPVTSERIRRARAAAEGGRDAR